MSVFAAYSELAVQPEGERERESTSFMPPCP